MNRLLDLFSKNNKKPAKKTKLSSQKKREASQSTNNGETIASTEPRRLSPKRVFDDGNTFRRIEHVPAHESVISREHGEISITPQISRDYIVLLKGDTAKSVIIVTSIEKIEMATGLDHVFLDIKQKCNTRGYKHIQKMYAPRQIIALMYENVEKSRDIHQEIKNVESISADFDKLLSDALINNVSDIHIEVRRNSAKVRYRVNGSLRVINDLPVTYARQLAIVVYQVIAEEKEVTFIESQQQAAIIDREVDAGDNTRQRVRVRLNTLPAYPDGFDMVMRLLKMGVTSKKTTLNSLGYSDTQLNDLNVVVSKPVGAIIIAGTTGSGKSTSLSTMISSKIEYYTNEAGCRIKVITVEDPPENEIKHATQVPVVRTRNGKNGKNPFAEAMKAALRSDPDIIMVGEVRDEDSTELLVHTVQSGHQAYTTLHTSSAIGIVSRLRSLGIKNDVLGSSDFFSGLIYQALVPVTCNCCGHTIKEFLAKNPGDMNASELCERINSVTNTYEREKVRFINREGCNNCVDGVSGRTVVAEVVVPDKKMKKFFSEGKDTLALEYFLERGGKTILAHGIDKMSLGMCDPQEIELKLGRLTDINHELNDAAMVEEVSPANTTSENNDETDLISVFSSADNLMDSDEEVHHNIDLSELELESQLLSGRKDNGQEAVIHKVDFGSKMSDKHNPDLDVDPE